MTIPDSVTWIGGGAFYGCTALETITIGSGVTSIVSFVTLAYSSDGSLTSTTYSGAFGNCSSLKTVYYNGTTSEWGEISIEDTDSEAGNYYLTQATIICTDGTYTY